ncbi:MAG: hydrolase, TatD family, partial [Bacteroidota bacterium]|nr:hydrolase, TatD family [Bacteroidota bacterium]
MMLIDTHCHLYLKSYDYDLKEVVERATQHGIKKIFLPAIDSETHERLHNLADKKFDITDPDFAILPMMGVHPCSIKENFEDELKIAEDFLNSGRKYYAVGEIGLDYYWDVSFKEQQVIAFERQIEWSIARNLPIAIHSRNSTADCIKSVTKYKGSAKGIFHCFSGTLEEAKEVIELGFYLGIGGVVTYKNTNLRETIQRVGLSNVVLETDAPYLTPLPHRGKRNEPAHIRIVCE